MVEDDLNSDVDGKWACDSEEKTFCLYIRIFNQGCNGIEKISITAYGDRVSGNTDLYGLFSMKNSAGIDDYFTFLSGWDGNGVAVGQKYENGTYIMAGVWITPDCSQNGSTNAHLSQTDDIFDIFADFSGDWVAQRAL